jgi:cob(I)alamin adenosyltransferase
MKDKAAIRDKKFKGYIQVYTGNGKGKTTAALGLALRAAGHGLKTYFCQFLKGQDYGELSSVRKLSPLITIEQFGRKGLIHVTENPDQEDILRARKGLRKCYKMMKTGEYRIIVLDEVNVAVHFKLFSEKEIHDFLDEKPEKIEVVLTGRYAPESFIKRADLVTEMKEVKHYYQKGVQARRGIEK